ncbi:MAG TPA: TIGR02186 family protein [Terriglobales bacterium]|nr:TIGR02186 family protein [Terriglobales bacterium]
MRLATHAVALLTLAVAGWASAGGQSAPPAGAIQIEPSRVEVGLFYNGTTVNVRVEVPAGYQAALRLSARPGPLELKRLGKRGGILWMGVGQVAFENVPALYQVLSTAPLERLGAPETLAAWKLGYNSLVPDGAPGADLRSQLVGLKEHEGLFTIQPTGLTPVALRAEVPRLATIEEAGNGSVVSALAGETVVLQGAFRLPPRAPVGDYSLELIGFKDGHAVRLNSATLHLEQVGMVLQLRRFAFDHGLAYGIAACLIAVVVGLLTGLIFQPKSDEAH